MIAVVSVLTEQEEIARTMLPIPEGSERIIGGKRSYFFIGEHDGGDVAWRDPFDGVLLIELRHFATREAARSWIYRDVRKKSRVL